MAMSPEGSNGTVRTLGYMWEALAMVLDENCHPTTGVMLRDSGRRSACLRRDACWLRNGTPRQSDRARDERHKQFIECPSSGILQKDNLR